MNKKSKSTRPGMKWYYLVFITGLVITLVTISTINGQVKKYGAENQSMISSQNNNSGEQGKKLTVWNIIQMTDWLFWPFVLITAGGIMLITYRGLVEHREQTRGQALLRGKIRVNGIRGMLQMVRNMPSNRASRLMMQMIATFEKTNRAEPIGDDINQFVTSERDSFETFNRINGFLSESAGALGLLGTVWGIFMTFHAGKLDGPTILQGMSVSLVTTLVGLIISLILNMGGTYVFTLFNNQLNLLANRAEELRQALLILEKQNNGTSQPEPASYNNVRVADSDYQPERRMARKAPSKIAFADI